MTASCDVLMPPRRHEEVSVADGEESEKEMRSGGIAPAPVGMLVSVTVLGITANRINEKTRRKKSSQSMK